MLSVSKWTYENLFIFIRQLEIYWIREFSHFIRCLAFILLFISPYQFVLCRQFFLQAIFQQKYPYSLGILLSICNASRVMLDIFNKHNTSLEVLNGHHSGARGQRWGLRGHQKIRKSHTDAWSVLLGSFATLVVIDMLANIGLERRDDTKAVWEWERAVRKCRIAWQEERQLRN